MQGIYKITYTKTGKCYVGSSINIEHRWEQHRSKLKSNTHHSQGLQNIYNKYGLDALKFEILEEVPIESDLREREQFWIDNLDSYFKGFNGYRFVDRKVEYNDILKNKISSATKIGMDKQEVKQKMREAKLGSKCPTVKLTEQQVEEIKLKLQQPINRRKLAKEYNVSIDAIDDILSGHNWSHIRPDIVMYKNNLYKLTEADVIKIKKLLQEGRLSQKKIADQFGVIQQTISDIKRGKLWSNI